MKAIELESLQNTAIQNSFFHMHEPPSPNFTGDEKWKKPHGRIFFCFRASLGKNSELMTGAAGVVLRGMKHCRGGFGRWILNLLYGSKKNRSPIKWAFIYSTITLSNLVEFKKQFRAGCEYWFTVLLIFLRYVGATYLRAKDLIKSLNSTCRYNMK